MRSVLKWIGIVIGALVGLAVLAVAVVYILSQVRINKSYDVTPLAVTIPSGEAAVERGRHLAITRGCTDCHGGNLAGGTLIDDPMVARLYVANLTPGEGGVGGVFTDEDWVRAIRHGIGPDGKPLMFMPSQEFYYLSDEDLGALIAYLKTLPPVDHQPSKITVGPLGRVLFLTGQVALVPAELIAHDAPRPDAPQPGVTEEYGQYLAVVCIGCHGAGYSGGPIPGAPPDYLPAANLTPGGDLANWTEEAFINTLRTGITPSGKQISPEYMPWPAFGQMSDDELKAIWLFLQSLPAREHGNR